MPIIRALSKRPQPSDPTKNEIALVAEMRAQKQELRRRIERDPHLRKDFNFLIDKTRLQPQQLITGLWLDCNLMKADRQTLLGNDKKELWPISEDTVRRTIKNVRRVIDQIRIVNPTDFSPSQNRNVSDTF